MSQLPISLTTFIGREQEIVEIKKRLANTRLLTLGGAGGSGKTRLALQVCREIERENLYKDGLRWVELAPLADPSFVPQALAKGLGVSEQPGRTLTGTLIQVLQDKSLLLVLDNCEHLIETCAALVLQVLEQCPGVSILTTSRERLSIEGEQVWLVPSLSLPTHGILDLSESDAACLFMERATTLQSDFQLDVHNAIFVTKICERLDGVPLAIELAAARVKVLTVQQIAERLDDAMRLLTDGKRMAPERHQTLRATMDWSHNLLSENEQVLFRRLSLFTGGFTLDAVEYICTNDTIAGQDGLFLLTHLVDKSIVIKEEKNGAARYRMLEPIRQYAREKLLDACEGEALSDSYLDFYLRLAEKAQPHLNDVEQIDWLNRLEAEHNNLRAAITWARESNKIEQELRLTVALRWFWDWLGYWGEAREHLSNALAPARSTKPTPTMTHLLPRAVMSLGAFMYELAESEADRYFDHATTLATAVDDPATIAEAMLYRGISAYNSGEHGAGRAHIEASLRASRAIGNTHLTAWALEQRGYNNLLYAAVNLAGADLEEALRLYRTIGHQFGIASAMSQQSLVTFHQGDYGASRVLNEQSLAIAQSIGGKRQIAVALQRLGQVFTYEGEYAKAQAYFHQNLALRRQMGERMTIVHILTLISNLKRLMGDLMSARTLAEEGLQKSKETAYRLAEAHALAALGRVALVEGDYTQARARFEECKQVREEIHNRLDMPQVLQDLGSVAFCEGNLSLAKAYYDETLQVSDQIGSQASIPIARRMLGFIALYKGDVKTALQQFTQGLSFDQQKNFRLGMIRHLPAFAALALGQRDAPRAARLLAAADALLQAIEVRLEPADAIAYDHTQSALGNYLDIQTLDRCQVEGRALTLEQAVEQALLGIESERKLIDAAASHRSKYNMGLTPRERELAALIAEGKSNREIAKQLVLSERTVENHIGNILSKLDFRSRTQIAMWAVEKELEKHQV